MDQWMQSYHIKPLGRIRTGRSLDPMYDQIRQALEYPDVSMEEVLYTIASAIGDNANECVADAHYKATELDD